MATSLVEKWIDEMSLFLFSTTILVETNSLDGREPVS